MRKVAKKAFAKRYDKGDETQQNLLMAIECAFLLDDNYFLIKNLARIHAKEVFDGKRLLWGMKFFVSLMSPIDLRLCVEVAEKISKYGDILDKDFARLEKRTVQPKIGQKTEQLFWFNARLEKV